MTKDDVIRMAREAREQTMKELPPNTFDLDLFHERFAALVAAQEREACAKVCDVRCVEDGWEGGYADECAAEIRARGQA
jgi:hypothetical protein